jgi:GTP:adenosylcobinamide-phosphate guanylyltransferase
MIIDFSEYMGQVRNDTGVLGKAFIFKVIDTKDNESYTFDVILFVHETVPPFVSTTPEDAVFDKPSIINAIFDKYPKKTLLEAEHGQ